MDSQRTLEAIATCQTLVSRFWNRLDAQDFEGLYGLLTPDAVWVRGGKELNGISEIKTAMAARSPTVVTRHAVSNIDLSADGDDLVAATSYVTVYHHNSGGEPTPPSPLHGPNLVLTVTDNFVRTGEGWKLARKNVERTFEAAHE